MHPEFNQVSDSKNLSQLIRSNAPEYWAHMKKHADLRKVEPYLRFEGTVAGDPHLGNFGPEPVTTAQGSREMRFINIDFDDAGQAPFVLDYIRYISAIKAQCEQIKSETLQEAYVHGLKGKSAAAPKKVQGCLDMSLAEYDDMAAKYTAKHSLEQGFKLKAGEIERYDGKIEASTIAKLFPHQRVLDIARRVEERGGSSNLARIWVLVEGAVRRRIMELKQYAPPGTARYREQPPAKEWLAGILQAFWPGLSGADYDLVTLGDAGLFWVREKKVTLIDVPYCSQKKHEVEFVMELATYDANILGLAHGRQAQSADYRAAIHSDPAGFHVATKEVERAYLKAAEEAFKRKG